jgi:hypothetical protein
MNVPSSCTSGLQIEELNKLAATKGFCIRRRVKLYLILLCFTSTTNASWAAHGQLVQARGSMLHTSTLMQPSHAIRLHSSHVRWAYCQMSAGQAYAYTCRKDASRQHSLALLPNHQTELFIVKAAWRWAFTLHAVRPVSSHLTAVGIQTSII